MKEVFVKHPIRFISSNIMTVIIHCEQAEEGG